MTARDDFDQVPLRDGPRRDVSEHGYITRDLEVFTDGFEVLKVQGDAPAEILSVDTLGGAQHLEQLGVLLAGPERTYGAEQQMVGFPPRNASLGELQPAVGATLSPMSEAEAGYELLVGYRVLRTDVTGFRRGLSVTYTVAGETYREVIPARIVVCARGHSESTCLREAKELFGL